MKIQDPQSHHGHTVVSPGVAPQMKVQAGSGVPGAAAPTPAGELPPSVAVVVDTTMAELQAAFARHAPAFAGLMAPPYVRRLEAMTVALLTSPAQYAPRWEDAVPLASGVLAQIDDAAEQHELEALKRQGEDAEDEDEDEDDATDPGDDQV